MQRLSILSRSSGVLLLPVSSGVRSSLRSPPRSSLGPLCPPVSGKRGFFGITSSSKSFAKLAWEIEEGKIPVVLYMGGSFSPPTLMHTRVMEEAKHGVEEGGKYQVIGGFMAPAHEDYGVGSQKELVPEYNRCAMVDLATADSTWVRTDPWETEQEQWMGTAKSLDRLKTALIDEKLYGDRETGLIQVRYVCGGDVLSTFSDTKPDGQPLWTSEDQEAILSHGVACVERAGTDVNAVIEQSPVLSGNRDKITVVKMLADNNISSSIIRAAIEEGRSVKYLMNEKVMRYIEKFGLYNPHSERAKHLAKWAELVKETFELEPKKE